MKHYLFIHVLKQLFLFQQVLIGKNKNQMTIYGSDRWHTSIHLSTLSFFAICIK